MATLVAGDALAAGAVVAGDLSAAGAVLAAGVLDAVGVLLAVGAFEAAAFLAAVALMAVALMAVALAAVALMAVAFLAAGAFAAAATFRTTDVRLAGAAGASAGAASGTGTASAGAAGGAAAGAAGGAAADAAGGAAAGAGGAPSGVGSSACVPGRWTTFSTVSTTLVTAFLAAPFLDEAAWPAFFPAFWPAFLAASTTPNFGHDTLSPFLAAFPAVSKKASSTFSASRLATPAPSATRFTNSDFFMVMQDRGVVNHRPAVAALLLALLLAACGDRNERLNFRPPTLGVPATATDVTGIYRSIHQGLLQLRGNGDLNLVVPEAFGATSGSFTLRDGDVTVRTRNCGDEVGSYRVEVVAGPIVSKSNLVFEVVADACEERRRYLTIDPWVYGDS